MAPLVLIHGNPETPAVWNHVLPDLRETGRDPICLSPPGFGSDVPPGFGATPIDYRDWLVDELERLGEPADLIGHDLGGGFVVLAVMQRPDLVRTWASDAVGLFHADYVWHDLAQIWQASPAGEDWIAHTLSSPTEEWAELLESIGMAEPTARELAPAFDAEMGRCILSHYRSAAQPAMADAGRRLSSAAQRPGLGIIAKADVTVGTVAQRREAIACAGATPIELPDAGHWWMTKGDQSSILDAIRELWDRA